MSQNKIVCALFFLVTFFRAHGFAADPVLVHLWEADSQVREGKTVSCYIQVSAATESQLVTMNLSLFAESVDRKIQVFTGLKIRAARYTAGQKETPIKLYGGWIRSSSGSTVGRLKPVNTNPEPHFLGAAAGLELFQELLNGIVKDGVAIGYQEKPGMFDKVIKVPDPLPPERLRNFVACLDDLRRNIDQ